MMVDVKALFFVRMSDEMDVARTISVPLGKTSRDYEHRLQETKKDGCHIHSSRSCEHSRSNTSWRLSRTENFSQHAFP